MIYVPEYENGNCVVVVSSDVIRVYETTPRNNSTVSYRDYYIKSNYIYNDGVATFSNYSTLPICRSSDTITTDVYYRNDLPSILFIFLVFAFIGLWIPWKILCRLFRRFN